MDSRKPKIKPAPVSDEEKKIVEQILRQIIREQRNDNLDVKLNKIDGIVAGIRLVLNYQNLISSNLKVMPEVKALKEYQENLGGFKYKDMDKFYRDGLEQELENLKILLDNDKIKLQTGGKDTIDRLIRDYQTEMKKLHEQKVLEQAKQQSIQSEKEEPPPPPPDDEDEPPPPPKYETVRPLPMLNEDGELIPQKEIEVGLAAAEVPPPPPDDEDEPPPPPDEPPVSTSLNVEPQKWFKSHEQVKTLDSNIILQKIEQVAKEWTDKLKSNSYAIKDGISQINKCYQENNLGGMYEHLKKLGLKDKEVKEIRNKLAPDMLMRIQDKFKTGSGVNYRFRPAVFKEIDKLLIELRTNIDQNKFFDIHLKISQLKQKINQTLGHPREFNKKRIEAIKDLEKNLDAFQEAYMGPTIQEKTSLAIKQPH